MARSLLQRNAKFEVRVVRVASPGLHLPGSLFVRYYIPAGGGRRIRVDTRELRCAAAAAADGCCGGGGDLFWGELASFECRSAPGSDVSPPRAVAFELRWRRRPAAAAFGVVGRGRSRLLGRAELAWGDAVASDGMAMERRVAFSPASRELDGRKPPELLVEIKICARRDGIEERRVDPERRHKGCGCDQCGWIGTEEDMFLAANI